MTRDFRQLVVVHGGPADALVVDREAAGLDHVERHVQAGRKADEGPEILGNVGFEQGQSHGLCSTRCLGRCSARVRVAFLQGTFELLIGVVFGAGTAAVLYIGVEVKGAHRWISTCPARSWSSSMQQQLPLQASVVQ
jgi:hypothetical protein